MFCWLCISIYLRNKNQLDAPFILNLFHQSISKCFGHICSPSSGGILYIYSNWYVFCFSVDCLLARLYIYSIPPDDGLQICPKHVEVNWRNKLRIKSASSWFLSHNHSSPFHFTSLTFRHRASCILGQAFHYSPENAFYIFNQHIYISLSDICLTVHHWYK